MSICGGCIFPRDLFAFGARGDIFIPALRVYRGANYSIRLFPGRRERRGFNAEKVAAAAVLRDDEF